MATRGASNQQLTAYNGQVIAEEISDKIKSGQDIPASILVVTLRLIDEWNHRLQFEMRYRASQEQVHLHQFES